MKCEPRKEEPRAWKNHKTSASFLFSAVRSRRGLLASAIRPVSSAAHAVWRTQRSGRMGTALECDDFEVRTSPFAWPSPVPFLHRFWLIPMSLLQVKSCICRSFSFLEIAFAGVSDLVLR